ncbi:MAG: hypothetical protein JO246_14570 [Frankiaceae bacterium]|nr:hypothetical protein [Frankiaceae bacterium]MBV9870313.1 hypothetical protein [Frankiaceae bacterium]
MPTSPLTRSVRSLLTAFGVAIAGVLVLDTTAIVAAPEKPSSEGLPPAPTHSNVGLRVIKWSGKQWLVFPQTSNGPDGAHTLSDSVKACRIDAKGRLHLRLTKVNGQWRGVQLEMLNPVNYGTYKFVTGSRLGHLAKPGVLGMFVYKKSQVPYTNEIDLEVSRSLHKNGYPLDAQYVVQPYYKAHHLHRYAIRQKYKVVSHQFSWSAGKVRFVTRAGQGKKGKRLGHFRFKGYDVPQPANEHVYINFHLHPNRPPGKGKKSVILKSFTYTGP